MVNILQFLFVIFRYWSLEAWIKLLQENKVKNRTLMINLEALTGFMASNNKFAC